MHDKHRANETASKPNLDMNECARKNAGLADGGRHDISNNDRSRTKPLRMKKLPVLKKYRADPPTQEWDTEIENDTTVGCKMCAFLGGHSKTAPPR